MGAGAAVASDDTISTGQPFKATPQPGHHGGNFPPADNTIVLPHRLQVVFMA
jgi:hypothetical protein